MQTFLGVFLSFALAQLTSNFVLFVFFSACEIGKSSYGILRVKEAFEYAFNIIDIALRNKYYFKVNPNRYYRKINFLMNNELEAIKLWSKYLVVTLKQCYFFIIGIINP